VEGDIRAKIDCLSPAQTECERHTAKAEPMTNRPQASGSPQRGPDRDFQADETCLALRCGVPRSAGEECSTSRGKEVRLAKLAQVAGRFDDMASHLKAVAKMPAELSGEERNLLGAAYEHAVGSRRAAWRASRSAEQEERAQGNEVRAMQAREYALKVEGEVAETCNTILGLLNDNLIAKASTVESKVFYLAMKADNYRYLAEFSSGAAKSKAAADARSAYEEASALAGGGLGATLPHRLGPAATADALAEARQAGLESLLLNLVARPEAVASGRSMREMLEALKATGGLVNAAKRRL